MKKSELKQIIREEILKEFQSRNVEQVVGLLKEDKEYIVWGIPPNERDETILFTKAKTYAEAKKVCDVLEKKYNCKKCRVQILDLSIEPDFKKVLNLK